MELDTVAKLNAQVNQAINPSLLAWFDWLVVYLAVPDLASVEMKTDRARVPAGLLLQLFRTLLQQIG
jgi:hypothetical protein